MRRTFNKRRHETDKGYTMGGFGSNSITPARGDPMRRTFTISAYLFLILMSLLSPRFLSSQETSLSPQSTNSLPNAPSAHTTISKPEASFHFAFRTFAPSFEQGQFLGTFWAPRFNPNASLEREIQTFEPCVHCKTLFGLSPRQRMIFVPTNDPMNRHTAAGSDELENYIHHIPVAGPMILRISQEPHLTRLLKVVQPQF